MRIIGCFSQFENGKNLVADYIQKRLGNHWYRCGFADNVKKVFCNIFDKDLEFIEKWKRSKEIPPGFTQTVREILVFIGDGCRSACPDIWIRKLLNEDKDYLISDGRYLLESDYIHKKGGYTILIWRPGYENDFPNPSEQEIMPFVNKMKNKPDGLTNGEIPFTFWLKNDGTLEDLYKKIDEIIIPVLLLY